MMHYILQPHHITIRHDMVLAVDWDVKHQFKQTNKQTTNKQTFPYA